MKPKAKTGAPKKAQHLQQKTRSFALEVEYLAVVDALALLDGTSRSKALRKIIREWNELVSAGRTHRS